MDGGYQAMKASSALWTKAKDLLLPYDGMASQIYVLDLPLSDLGIAVDEFCAAVSKPMVTTSAGIAGEAAAVTSDMRDILIASSWKATHHVLKGDWPPCEVLNLWLWTDRSRETFDVELVFWADLLFPTPDDQQACIASFSECVALAEAFRRDHPNAECVLSSSELGDPREDREKTWTLFW